MGEESWALLEVVLNTLVIFCYVIIKYSIIAKYILLSIISVDFKV